MSTGIEAKFVNAGRVYALSSKMFTTDQAKADFAAYMSKANSLSAAAKGTPKNQKPAAGSAKPDRFTKLKTLQNELVAAEDKVIADIVAGSCTVLGGGCFAAGTKLWTPDGYRRIEEFQVGDLILSRDEHHPAGLIEPKPVEKVFVRLTEVWHLHVGEQTIRTTAEHPFYVHDRAWVPAEELQPGDWILTAAGEWKKVEEAWNTGEIETVYNLTVADWHTYFVGDEGWGWAAWAHNAYKFEKKTAGKYNYSTGEYRQVIDKGASGYSRIWWVPNNKMNQLPTEGVQNQVCLDNSTKLGDQLQASAQAIADGWTDKPADIRYGSYYQSTIIPILEKINSFLSVDQKFTLDGVDKYGKRQPDLTAPNSEYNNAVSLFWKFRATAIGAYVHKQLDLEYRNTKAGLIYNSGKGPDFSYTEDKKTVYFEVLPETPKSLRDHSKRGMNTL